MVGSVWRAWCNESVVVLVTLAGNYPLVTLAGDLQARLPVPGFGTRILGRVAADWGFKRNFIII